MAPTLHSRLPIGPVILTSEPLLDSTETVTSTPPPASLKPTHHPYLSGNFYPIHSEHILTPCEVTHGSVPRELWGGSYVRNGGNPVYPPGSEIEIPDEDMIVGDRKETIGRNGESIAIGETDTPNRSNASNKQQSRKAQKKTIKVQGRHYHWFDGDGMLHGVYFPSASVETPHNTPPPAPRFTNRHLSTPILSLTLLLLRSPLPSIALLISPLSSLHRILAAIFQTVLLAFQASVGTLSVANTNVIWWGRGLGEEAKQERKQRLGEKAQDDGQTSKVETLPTSHDRDTTSAVNTVTKGDHRLLALCESGPPLEVRLPALETVGWDKLQDSLTHSGLDDGPDGQQAPWYSWRKWGLARLQENWMTAHPRVDPVNGDLIFYSCQMFDRPHVRYSVIDRNGRHKVWKMGVEVGRAKMMHDFGVSRKITVIMNLPLTLDPLNMLSFHPQPMIHFDRSLPSEFILFSRDGTSIPPTVFTDKDPCMIFHTANTWDDFSASGEITVDMLSCRFASAKLVYAAGGMLAPPEELRAGIDDVVRLHYHRFLFANNGSRIISHSFALSVIPFEFPTIHPRMSMSKARYVYGCTMRQGGFDERLGGAAKVDCLVKLDVLALTEKGRRKGCDKKQPVDQRSVLQILEGTDEKEENSLIEVFAFPEGWYAQEASFLPRVGEDPDEDNGFLLTYVYDETSYIREDGTASEDPGTGSELWVIDAKLFSQGMEAVVCRIKLPQRVPYGLHGTWVDCDKFFRQRQLPDSLPPQPSLQEKMYQSRLNHFVDVLGHRPSYREKFSASRFAFHIMVAFSCIMLIFATSDLVAFYAQSTAAPAWIASVNNLCQEACPSLPMAGQFFPWLQGATSVFLLSTVAIIRTGS